MVFKKEYIPRWIEESQRLYEKYSDSGEPEIGDNLLTSLDSTILNEWESSVEHLDFTKHYYVSWVKPEHPYRTFIDRNRIPNRIDEAHTLPPKQALKQL